MQENNKQWIHEVQFQAGMLKRTVCVIPAGSRLETDDLNKFIMLLGEIREDFIFLMELHGFRLSPNPDLFRPMGVASDMRTGRSH
jgi:hypothetical protein